MKQVDNTWKLSCKLILFEGTEAVLNDCLIWQYFGDFFNRENQRSLGFPTNYEVGRSNGLEII